MDRSRQNASNSSPGFVYFNTNSSQEYKNPADTTDFLAFNNSPQASPQSQKFRPSYYSSPQPKFPRGSPRSYPQNNRKYHRWSGGNRSWNSSNNSSYHSQNTSIKEGNDEQDISKFIHPSFLEDPWAQLEAKLKEKTQENSAVGESIESEPQST